MHGEGVCHQMRVGLDPSKLTLTEKTIEQILTGCKRKSAAKNGTKDKIGFPHRRIAGGGEHFCMKENKVKAKLYAISLVNSLQDWLHVV